MRKARPYGICARSASRPLYTFSPLGSCHKWVKLPSGKSAMYIGERERAWEGVQTEAGARPTLFLLDSGFGLAANVTGCILFTISII